LTELITSLIEVFSKLIEKITDLGIEWANH